jgi:hypothetical protein
MRGSLDLDDNSSVKPASRRAVLSRDTDAPTERLQVALWRRMSDAEKLASASGTTRAALAMLLTGIQARDPEASGAKRFLAVAAAKLGADVLARAYGAGVPSDDEPPARTDPVDVALRVADAFERCGLRYVLGGSLASSINGEPRSTLDVDMMVDITESAVGCVIEHLGSEFHAEPEGFLRAIRARTSVNVVHLATATKVDLFIMGALPIEGTQMQRRRKVEVAGRAGAQLYVYTAEDILLQKLRWYKLGGSVSDRQWRDILGILMVQGLGLDMPYLQASAAEIEVDGLLDHALRETDLS